MTLPLTDPFKQVGADGNLWIMQPDNESPIITVTAPGRKHYYAWVTPAKYKLTILANGNDLSITNPEFCAGQNITFSLGGLPIGSIANMIGQWVLPQKYVNEPWQNQQWVVTDPISGAGYWNPYGSQNYRLDSSLLQNTNQTSCWYVNGQGGQVAVELGLTFNNGQYAVVAANGSFGIVRAHAVNIMATCGGVNMFLNSDGSLNKIALSDANGNGMAYQVFVQRPDLFSGTAFFTQLINRQLNWNANPLGIPGWDSTGGNFWLDTCNPYQKSTSFPLTENGHLDRPGRPVYLSDAPELGEPPFGFYNYAEVQDSFSDYLQFQPDGANSIPITIALVTWNWHGKATKTGTTWSLVISDYDGPNFDPSDNSFPEWLQMYLGTLGN